MATQRVGIAFDFNANTSKAQANLNALEKTMGRLENRMVAMGRTSAANAMPTQVANKKQELKMFGDSQIDLKTPIRQTDLLTESIRKGKMGWHDYGQAVKNNGSIVTQQLAMQTAQIKNVQKLQNGKFGATFSPNKDLIGISAIEMATARMNTFGQATKAVSQNVIDVGKNLAFSARQMSISLTMPMAIMGGLAIKQFADMDKQLTNIAKVYDVEAENIEKSTGQIRNSMKDLAMELSRTQGAEIKDTLGIAQYYAQMGKTGNDLRESTIQASRLMTLGDVDINDAQKTITTLTSVVGANADELGRYVDYLNKVEDSTQLTMQDFAATLPTIAPLVKSFIPEDKDAQMMASANMMETARRAGFDPKESMNAWKSLFGSFARPAKSTEDKYATLAGKYGADTSLRGLVEQKGGDPVEILRELSQITKNWAQTDKNEIMTQLAGKWQISRGLGFMQALDPTVGNNQDAINRMGNINDQLVKNPEKLADNSARQMDMIRNSAHNKLQQLKQQVTMLFADLGEKIFLPVMDSLEKVMGFARGLFEYLDNIPGPLKEAAKILAQLTFVAGPLLAAMAAGKMLAGFGGRMIAGAVTKTAGGVRRVASMSGTNMKGSGRLESRQESIAGVQKRDAQILNTKMQAALDQERRTQEQISKTLDQKNAKTREAIALQAQLKAAVLATNAAATPRVQGAAAGAKQNLNQYTSALQSKTPYPMAISGSNIGPQAFRNLVAQKGAPASRMTGTSAIPGTGPQGKLFPSLAPVNRVSLAHSTPYTQGQLGDKHKDAIKKELKAVNAGIAIRKDRIESEKKAIASQLAQRPTITNRARGKSQAANNKLIAAINKEVHQRQQNIKNLQRDGQILGTKSYGLNSLESQRAQLIGALNGSYAKQIAASTKIAAAQNKAISTTPTGINNGILPAPRKNDMVGAVANTYRNTGASIMALKNGDASIAKDQMMRGVDNARSMWAVLSTSARKDMTAIQQQKKAWSKNTLRGAQGDQFRGSMTPKEVNDARKSSEWKSFRKDMYSNTSNNGTVNLPKTLKELEEKREKVRTTAEAKYLQANKGDSLGAAKAGQAAMTSSAIPTTAAFSRLAAEEGQKAIQRADTLANRQEKIAASSEKWAGSVGGAATAFAMVGGIASSLLGIQSQLLNTVLGVSAAIGAVAMLMPTLASKVVASFANAGANIVDSLDGKRMGSKVGNSMGDTMGTSMSSKMSKSFSKVGAMMMTAVPYVAGIAAALLAAKFAMDAIQKSSKDYAKSLEEANRSTELHAELLGYVRKEEKPTEAMNFEEATTARANAYRDNEDGRSSFIKEMANVSGPAPVKIRELDTILSKEAIKILDDGGSQADIRSMVVAALEAAGINDQVVIDGITDIYKKYQINAETTMMPGHRDEMRTDFSGEGTARSWGDQFFDSGKRSKTESAAEARTNDIEEARTNLTDDANAQADKWTRHLGGAISQADSEKAKADIAKTYFETVRGGLEMAGDDVERIGTNMGMSSKVFEGVLNNLDSVQANGILDNVHYEPMKDSLLFQEAAIGGTEQYDTAEEGAERYAAALAEIESNGKTLEPEQKRLLHNVIANAGGMDNLAEGTHNLKNKLGEFTSTSKAANVALKDLTAGEYMKNLASFEGGDAASQMEEIAHQGKDANEVLANTPDEFHKRWSFALDVEGADGVANLNTMLRAGQQAGMDYAMGEASRRMEKGHASGLKILADEGEAAADAVDAAQKASEKAFEARSKAMDDAFKNQTKELENKQKAEKKIFDKQQKEEDKAFQDRQKADQKKYDKAEKEQSKTFSKSQEKDRKAFDDSWDARSDSVNDYFDNAIKAVDEQGKAEDRLDQLRERNAERERRRREYLAAMANTNIDINVAVAGGNLDEAARLANGATASATDYYQESISAEEGYASEDRGDARATQTESLGNRREGASEEFNRQREGATEVFEDGQEVEQEAFDEELQKARDVYEAKKLVESEQFAEQQALEAERYAEQQALEQERLAAEQERAREALEAEKEMVSERYAAEKEAIAETTQMKQEAAQEAIEEQKRSLDTQLAKLKEWVPTNHAEMQQWMKELERIYDEHGVELGNFGSEIHNGMTESMTAAMDAANNKIRTDQRWNELGLQIGGDLRNGLLKGIVGGPAAAAAALLFGTDVKDPPPPVQRHDPSYNNFANYANGPARRAMGGPIFGPGTETSDSIPALLSNGEHVLTAEEVRAAGGHKAVERLRAAMKSGRIGRFAVGGGVGESAGVDDGSELNVRVASTGAGTTADGGVLSAVATDVANMGTAFDSTLANTVAPAWQMFGDTMVAVKRDSIDPVLEGSKIALSEFAATTNQIMSANMNPAWVQFGQNLQMVKTGVWDVVMTDMKAGITSLASSMSTTISNQIMPKWTEGSNHVRNMQDQVIAPAMQATRDATTQTAQNFGTAADMIGTGWARVKENSAAPVRYTIGTVYNDGLVGMWNKVADALDLDKMDTHDFSFASGGVMPGYTPGQDVHHFRSPTGGNLHLSGGEAIMRPEWTRAVGGPKAVHQMNSDAKHGKTQRFKDGGVVDAPGGGKPKGKLKMGGDSKPEAPAAVAYGMPNGTQISYGSAGFPSWVYNIGGQFGLQASTYAGHQENDVSYPGFTPNPARQNRGIDWSGPVDKMHTFAQYLVANGPSMPQLEQVIWMHPGTGQRIGWYGNAPDIGGSIFAGDYGGHQDHVHTRQSQSLDGSGSMDGVILGLGGMGMTVDPKIIAAIGAFNEEKNALKDKISAHIDAGPNTIMKAIPGKMFSGITAGMDKKIQAAMPLMGGGMAASLGAYGLNHEDHVREIIAAAHERGLPKEAARIAIATALVESELRMYASHAVPESLSFPHEAIGSDHDSVGLFQQRQAGWGTTAERMNARASAGMFYNALMKFDWKSMDPGAAAQKVQVSAYPAKYGPRMAEADALINMVGGFDSNAGGIGGLDDKSKKTLTGADNKSSGGDYFDKGGLAHGKGFLSKDIVSPERVLSPRQTSAFEKLVPAMNRVAGGGLQESDYMAKTTFDRSAAFNKMIERNSQAEIDFTKILEKITPIISQLVGSLKSQVVPGITGYANDLIQLDTDAARIDKVSADIIGAINGIQAPQISNDLQFTVGGNVYGDAQLRAMLEQWQRDTIRQIEMRQAAAQQAIGGK